MYIVYRQNHSKENIKYCGESLSEALAIKKKLHKKRPNETYYVQKIEKSSIKG